MRALTKKYHEEGRKKFGTLFDRVTAILTEEDLARIVFPFPPDEYDPEAATILPRLEGARMHG